MSRVLCKINMYKILPAAYSIHRKIHANLFSCWLHKESNPSVQGPKNCLKFFIPVPPSEYHGLAKVGQTL